MNILSITNPSQLAEFCSMIIPCIWARSFKRAILLSPKRHTAFKLFVQKVLKATQISCTCVILAIYYIQRLRTAYPSIRASIGSEVRLFTTALVLANKYLDDNTFTNKTWSEVSSIPVNELNIMEMEFLSALNYTIHIPHTQFFEWSQQCQQWWTTMIILPQVVEQSTLIHNQPIKRSFDYSNQDVVSNNNKRRCSSIGPITPPPPPPTHTATLKRSYDYIDTQPRKKFFSMEQLYYPTSTVATNIVCKPILSWSSSVSALSSSKYNNNYNSY